MNKLITVLVAGLLTLAPWPVQSLVVRSANPWMTLTN